MATESGIVHQMRKASPQKEFIEGPPEGACACNECPFMRLNTLEKVYLALRDLAPRIEMDAVAAGAGQGAYRSDAGAELRRSGASRARTAERPRLLAPR